MKSYLARLAAGAAGQGSAIRPLLEPAIGFGGIQPEGAETMEFASSRSVASLARGERLATDSVTRPPGEQAVTSASKPPDPVSHEAPKIQAETRGSRETSPVVMPLEKTGLTMIEPHSSEDLRPEQPDSAAPPTDLVPLEIHAVTNLLPPESQTPPDSRPRAGPRAASKIIGPRKAHAPERARTPAGQGADDIQIHIGRVEVWAAPPAPTRPPPAKAARKAPQLGDYLERRNGRSS